MSPGASPRPPPKVAGGVPPAVPPGGGRSPPTPPVPGRASGPWRAGKVAAAVAAGASLAPFPPVARSDAARVQAGIHARTLAAYAARGRRRRRQHSVRSGPSHATCHAGPIDSAFCCTAARWALCNQKSSYRPNKARGTVRARSGRPCGHPARSTGPLASMLADLRRGPRRPAAGRGGRPKARAPLGWCGPHPAPLPVVAQPPLTPPLIDGESPWYTFLKG